MTIERKEVFIFGRWVSVREAKQILSGIQLPQVPGGTRNFTDTSGWTTCGSTCTTCPGSTSGACTCGIIC